jgi:hypothetical protein
MPDLAPNGADGADLADLVARVQDAVKGETAAGTVITGPSQLVHADLAGNVLLDEAGAPVVIDVAPAWRPVQWADAVCVLDSVLWMGAPRAALGGWARGPARDAMLRALIFRLLSDVEPDVEAYAEVLSELS